jgi:hypothetical protein
MKQRIFGYRFAEIISWMTMLKISVRRETGPNGSRESRFALFSIYLNISGAPTGRLEVTFAHPAFTEVIA